MEISATGPVGEGNLIFFAPFQTGRADQDGAPAPTREAPGAPKVQAAKGSAGSTGEGRLGERAQRGLIESKADEARGGDGLTEEERELVDKLAARDREVRRHEEAHARVGGQYAGQPSYSYQTGPDGKRYAIGGEVPIDVAPVPDDPEATISKMDVVKRAALAPAEPSAADRRIAAIADAQRQSAVIDLMAEQLESRLEGDGSSDRPANAPGIIGLAEILGQGPEAEPGQDLARAA